MKIFCIVAAIMVCMISFGEVRTWTSTSGKTIEGEYEMYAFEKVYIRKADGEQVKIPIEQLRDEDREFVELENPPELKVEYRKSTPIKQYVADDWESNQGWRSSNHPIFISPSRFGAEVFKKSSNSYDHQLTLEMYVLSQQNLEPNNFHLIAHIKSEPFKLTEENDYKFEFEDPKVYNIVKYNLYSKYPRGEILGEYLVLVRDKRGKVIAYNGTKKWMTKYLDRLEELNVGAWINNKCERVRPQSPTEPWDTRRV